MSIDYWDPRILTGVIIQTPRVHSTFTRMFVPQSPLDGETADLQVVKQGVSMLPAISNAAPGTMRQHDSRHVLTVKTPRFRPKRLFKAADLLKNPAGNNPYDPLDNPLERAIREDMEAHRRELDYTVEVMCAQVVVSGHLDLYDVIDGKPVKRETIDFLRPDSHRFALTGGALWSSPDSDLLGQIDEWSDLIADETNLPATDLYLGAEAWTVFRRHKDVIDNLDNRNIESGSLELKAGAEFKGVWNGLKIWVLRGKYTDISGKVKSFLDSKSVLLIASGAENHIEYGRPVDLDCLGPVEVFAKFFKEPDPSAIFTVAESRPLPWTKQPGWTVLAKVLS